MTKFIIGFALTLFSFTAFAQQGPYGVIIQVNRVMGAGCPAGSASANVSPDGSTVSIIFDRLNTDIPATAERVHLRTQCTVELGLKFGGQYRMAIIGSDVRGFASVPSLARSKIKIQHRSIFSWQPKDLAKMNFQREIVGPHQEDLMMQTRFSNRPLWSHCGTQMRYNTMIFPFMWIALEIESENSNPTEGLITSIDTLDVGGDPALVYHLAWKRDTKNCPK